MTTDGAVRKTAVVSTPEPPRRRWTTLLIGVVLLVLALVQLGQRYLHGDAPRADVSAEVPAAFAGLPIALEETAPPSSAVARVVLRIGERRYAGGEPVWRDPGAPANDWLTRYAGRFRVAAGEAPGGSLVIVELLREHSTFTRTAWRSWVVTTGGEVEATRSEQPTRAAEREIQALLYGRPPPRAALWPPVAGLILGTYLFVGAGLYRRPSSWPSVGLVCVSGALASIIAWPIMLNIGLGRTLPGAMIGVFITACLAALFGARAQALIERGRLAGYLAGAAFAAALFMAFVNVYVTVGGFVAPVFRAPGEIVSPLDLLVADYVAPAIGLLASGTLPAALAGLLFAGWWRRLVRRHR